MKNKTKKLFLIYKKRNEEKIKYYYQMFIYLIITLNIILFIFQIIYKFQIYKIKNEIFNMNKKLSLLSSKNIEQSNNNNKILVNLFGNPLVNKKFLIETLNSKAELDLILEWTKLKNNEIFLCYKGSFDKKNKDAFEFYCNGKKLIFIFKLSNKIRIGAYISNYSETNLNKFIIDKNAFLFNIDKKEKFMIKDEKKSFVYYDTKNRKEIIFEFGDLDLVINEEWDKGKKNLSKFPKNYINKDINDFTESEHFDIIEIEIFSKFFYNFS